MGRLVESKKAGIETKAAAGGETNTQIKDHLDRVAKYVPAEVIAVFISVNAAIDTLPINSRVYAYGVNVLLWWIVTPFYFKWVARKDETASIPVQQRVSFVAYIIWAYAFTGQAGVFGSEGLNIYYPGIALAVLSIFSFISGFIIPEKK